MHVCVRLWTKRNAPVTLWPCCVNIAVWTAVLWCLRIGWTDASLRKNARIVAQYLMHLPCSFGCVRAITYPKERFSYSITAVEVISLG
jgi:hypothetical protein